MCGVYMYSSATYSYVSLQVVKVKACGANVPSTRTSTVLIQWYLSHFQFFKSGLQGAHSHL